MVLLHFQVWTVYLCIKKERICATLSQKLRTIHSPMNYLQNQEIQIKRLDLSSTKNYQLNFEEMVVNASGQTGDSHS